MILRRQSVLAACRALLEERRAGYLRELASLDEAAARETKSSAGDKYETAREMIAQSRRLMERNLADTEEGLLALERMAAAPAGDRVGFGSLLETDQVWYLVGLSMGEVALPGGGPMLRTLTLASPLGQVLRNRQPGETFAWRGKSVTMVRLVKD